PHVMRFNMQELEIKQAYAKLAGIAFPALNEIKNTNERAELFATEFIVLSKKLGLPTRMRDINIPKEACREMSVEAMKQQRLLVNNPKTVTQKDAEKIYELAW
ncbi:MAG: iron-containing alcohol dehydrogenase, partial [Pseudomonadota bacterium]|nr:iron-containing alcohol dehydrogenase [Pseudomonadota bacterium]